MSETQKHTKPNVPNLRFPGFEGEWESFALGQLCEEFQSGKGIKSDQIKDLGSYPVYGGNGLRGYTDSYNHEGVYTLIGRQGAKCGNVRLVSGRTYITEHAVAVKANQANVTEFLNWLFIKMDLGQYSDQSAQPGLAVNKLVRLNAFVPKKEEQKRIADLMTLIDARIAIQNKVIEDCNTLEKEIQNQVFDKIHAPLVPLSSISQRITERNSALESDNVLTISAREGLVSQLEFFKKFVASENLSNYFLLHKGDFAYNKSYSSDYPWGAIKHLERYDTGVLSPLYFCFRPNKEMVDTRYLQFFFDTKLWHKHIVNIAVEGARNHGLLNMAVGDFYTMPILLPTMNEQLAIAEKLSAIRRKKVAEESIYRLFLQQKRYLLEKLFV